MNGFKIHALKDLSYVLPAKYLQHETYISTNTFKHCLPNFLKTYRKQENNHNEFPCNVTRWFFPKQSYPCRKYHTWKLFKIKNDAPRYNNVFVSNIRRIRQEQNANYGSSQYSLLTHFENSKRQKSLLYLRSAPFTHRIFASRSCITMQQYPRKDRIFLAKEQSFSCDASKCKKSADCKKNSKLKNKSNDACSQKRLKNKKNCGKPKDECISSENVCDKNELCKRYTCPELKKRKLCIWEQYAKEGQKCNTKEQVSSRECARESTSFNCLQEQPKSCKKDCTKSKKSSVIDEDSTVEKIDCESKCEKVSTKCDFKKKDLKKCMEIQNEISKQKKNPPRRCYRNYDKTSGKRHYSQKSIFFSQDHKSFSTLVPNIIFSANVNKTHRFYSSCDKDEEQEQICEEPKKECETKEEPKCEERKEESVKEQIDREYREIDECKKGFKKVKDVKVKMVSVEHKPSTLDCVISLYKKQYKKDHEKCANISNESIISNDNIFKWFKSKIGEIPIFIKDISLFNVMFDRLFPIAKLDYRNDFAIERTINDDKIAWSSSANSGDFIEGDELPNYDEIEYEDEEDDVYDRFR